MACGRHADRIAAGSSRTSPPPRPARTCWRSTSERRLGAPRKARDRKAAAEAKLAHRQRHAASGNRQRRDHRADRHRAVSPDAEPLVAVHVALPLLPAAGLPLVLQPQPPVDEPVKHPVNCDHPARPPLNRAGRSPCSALSAESCPHRRHPSWPSAGVLMLWSHKARLCQLAQSEGPQKRHLLSERRPQRPSLDAITAAV